MLHTLILLAAACLPASAQKKEAPPPAQPPPGVTKDFHDLSLSITLPESFSEPKELPEKSEQLRQRWTAKIGSVDLGIELWIMEREKFDFEEPEDVMDTLLFNLRDPKRGDPDFSFEEQHLLAGNYGVAAYASLARGALRDREGTKEVGTRFMLGGMLEKYGYSLEVLATPQPGPEGLKAIEGFFKSCIAFKGATRDPKWTEAEVKARWAKDAPEKLAARPEKLELIRTDHYLVMTDSSGGKKFAEQMEKNYQAIKKVFPFSDVAGRKLMPVFLFKTSDEYYEFFAKQFNTSIEEASKSKGVASGDWYATWYEAPGDLVHIHEGTHQIFRNRLRLPGGGSWFQEGVAEYMSSTKNDRNVAARAVQKGKHTPLVDFVKIRSLLFSAEDDKKGGNEAAGHYDLAALLIEFLCESKFGKEKFQAFVHTVGLAARNSPVAIERAVKSVYGTDIAGLEKQWVEYCKTRK
jgi:hypothetical protein